MGAPRSFAAFAQGSQGQRKIAEIGFLIFGKQDIEPGAHGAVLVGVIQDNDTAIRFKGFEFVDTPAAVGGQVERESMRQARKFLQVLHRFVAGLSGRHVFACQQVLSGLAPVAAAHHAHVADIGEQAHQVFGHRGLAAAPGAEVAHADKRKRKTGGGKPSAIVQAVAHRRRQGIERRERGGENA